MLNWKFAAKKHIKAKTKRMFHFFHERNENQKINCPEKQNQTNYPIWFVVISWIKIMDLMLFMYQKLSRIKNGTKWIVKINVCISHWMFDYKDARNEDDRD